MGKFGDNNLRKHSLGRPTRIGITKINLLNTENWKWVICLLIHYHLPWRGLLLAAVGLRVALSNDDPYLILCNIYSEKENTDYIEDVKYLFSHSVLVPISLSRANLTLLFGSVFKSVVNCGPHSRSGGTTQEIMESQKRSACRYHSYYCVQYLLHHSLSPSVMRGYRLHKPVSAIPSHSLPRHHRLTRGLTLSFCMWFISHGE